MSGFERFITFALIQIAVYVIIYFISKEKDDEIIKSIKNEHIIIRTPRLFLLVGIIGISVCTTFIFLMLFYPNGTEAWWVFIIFGSGDLLGMYIISNTLIWKIEVFRNENYFLYRKSPFKTYKIKYEDCLYFQENINKGVLIVKTNKKTVTANMLFTNYECLPAMLIKNGVPCRK